MSELTLKWEKFGLSRGLYDMLGAGELVDVTLACQGEFLQAHKSVLAACSQQFRQIFLMNPCQHPVVFMQDVQLHHLQALLTFIYTGETTVQQRELPGFMRTAEALQISGLTKNNSSFNQDWENTEMSSSSNKRQRLHEPHSSGSSDFMESPRLTSPAVVPIELGNSNHSSNEASTSQHSQIVNQSKPHSSHDHPENSAKKSAPPTVKIELPDINFLSLPKNWPTEPSASRNNAAQQSDVVTDSGSSEKYIPRRTSALLDGKFFKVVKDTLEGLWAQCQLCAPHYKVIKGSWETTSNFKTHLTRVHRDQLSAYEEYKLTLRYGENKHRFMLPPSMPSTTT